MLTGWWSHCSSSWAGSHSWAPRRHGGWFSHRARTHCGWPPGTWRQSCPVSGTCLAACGSCGWFPKGHPTPTGPQRQGVRTEMGPAQWPWFLAWAVPWLGAEQNGQKIVGHTEVRLVSEAKNTHSGGLVACRSLLLTPKFIMSSPLPLKHTFLLWSHPESSFFLHWHHFCIAPPPASNHPQGTDHWDVSTPTLAAALSPQALAWVSLTCLELLKSTAV